MLRRKGTGTAQRNAPEKVTQHATRGAAKRAASEKPKPRKRAKAEAAFGNEQAPLLGLDVYHRDEADLRTKALGSPICIVRGLLKATTDDEDPFALPLLRRDHGSTKVKMVLQRPMAKPGWKLPPQTSALRTLGPYIDAMRRDLEENTSPDTSKPLEFAANVDTSNDDMAPQLDALKSLLPNWLLWQSDEDALRFVRQGVPGMTAPQLYLKRKGVWTGGHEENLRFSSVNCCHGPGSSRWFAVDPQHASKVRTLVKEKCQVDIYVDEGNWWPDPAWLRSYGIPVREGLQKAGDVVVLKGGTLHWVVCDDLPSVHSSWNFGVQCAQTFEAALERAALNDVIRYPNIIAVRSLLLDLAAHLVDQDVNDAKLLAVCSSSAAVVARAARRDEHAIRQARLGIEGEPEGALVIRCDGCGADLPVFYTRCDACFGCQNGTPFMCVGCGLRHRRRHKDISAVAKQSIGEVEALATKCASLCGAPAPDFTEQVLGKKRGAMKACPQCAKLIPNRCETCPACGGNAVKKRSSKKRRRTACRRRGRTPRRRSPSPQHATRRRWSSGRSGARATSPPRRG